MVHNCIFDYIYTLSDGSTNINLQIILFYWQRLFTTVVFTEQHDNVIIIIFNMVTQYQSTQLLLNYVKVWSMGVSTERTLSHSTTVTSESQSEVPVTFARKRSYKTCCEQHAALAPNKYINKLKR